MELAEISLRTVRRKLLNGVLFGRRSEKNFCFLQQSDESKLNLFKNDGLAFFRHSTGTRLHKKFVIPTVKNGDDLIMIWEYFVGPLYLLTDLFTGIYRKYNFKLNITYLINKNVFQN